MTKKGKTYIEPARAEAYRHAAEMYNAGKKPAEIRAAFSMTPQDYHKAIVWARDHGLRLTKRQVKINLLAAKDADAGDYKPRQIKEWPHMPTNAFRDRK